MMAQPDGSDVLEELSREQLKDLCKLYAHHLLTIDGWWFLSVEHSSGLDTAIKLDEEVWRRYGEAEAVRLKKFLGMDWIATLEDIREVVLLSPM